MDYFFIFDISQVPEDAGMGLFTAAHIGWLCAAAVAAAVFCVLFRRVDRALCRRVQMAMAITIMLSELLRLCVYAFAGLFTVWTLPLHLCGIAAYLCFFHALRGGALAGEFLYCLCMPGALFALITPEWAGFPAFSLLSINTFAVHILLMCYPLALVAGGIIRPDAKRLPKCFLMLFLTAMPIALLDRLAGVNFMFLNWPSPGSPLEFFAKHLGNPGYVLGFFPIIAAVWLVLYLPGELIKRKIYRNHKKTG